LLEFGGLTKLLEFTGTLLLLTRIATKGHFAPILYLAPHGRPHIREPVRKITDLTNLLEFGTLTDLLEFDEALPQLISSIKRRSLAHCFISNGPRAKHNFQTHKPFP
jgi:hypothetical protein